MINNTIVTSSEIEKLNVPFEIKERAKKLLWEKGSKALKEFLESANINSVSRSHALDILKALYPGKNDRDYENYLYHLSSLGILSD